MNTQLDLAGIAREEGMQRALDNANHHNFGWSDRAITILKDFLTNCNSPFMAENFREYAEKHGLEEPPSKRAFGGIMTRAKGQGWIKSIGLGPTSNPLAHRANAAIWLKA